MKTTIRRALTAAALALATTAAFTPAASAATTTATFDCRGDSALGAQYFTYAQTADVTAPATVAAGGALTIVVDPARNTVPTSVNGFTVRRVHTMALKLPVPANSTYVSASLSGGSNVGTTSLSHANGVLTLTASGPMAGGATFELPTVTIRLTAGAAGTSIQTRMYGTSHSDPGLTFTAAVASFLGESSVPTRCFPNPNPVVTTTSVV